MQSFPYTVTAGDTSGASFTITVKIDVTPESPQGEIMGYLRSHGFKLDLQSNWLAKNFPGFGIAVRGGPRPVFKNVKDRFSGVIACEQEYRVTRPI